ncbi:MAG: SusE domain-containing protein [Alistipes finegoldii]
MRGDPAHEHDGDPVRETLELTASSSQIALDENHNLTATVLTFDWTPARSMSDEYLVSSTRPSWTLLTNNFGSSTTIETSEDDGIFSRSYTSEQLNNWANERWKVPVNKTFTLAFRVIARCMRAVPLYEMPGSADRRGDRNPGSRSMFSTPTRCRFSGVGRQQRYGDRKTVENANLYAWYGALSIGERCKSPSS